MANDSKIAFADGDSIAANAGAATTLDVLDLGSTGTTFWPLNSTKYPDPAGGTRMVWEVMVTDEAMAGNGAVVTFALYNHTAATSINSGTLVDSFVVTLGASGVATGKFLHKAPLPASRISKRYLGMYVSVATQNLTAGKIDSALAMVQESNDAHGLISPVA